MTRSVLAFLDVQSPEVRALIQSIAPPDIDIRMATTGDLAEQTALAADAEFVVGGITKLPSEVINAAPKLRLIHKWGIGVDKIDLEAARARGVPVVITAGANARPVADHALLLMLATVKHLNSAQAKARAGLWWEARGDARTQNLQMQGKLVGLVGLGNIGRQVTKRLHGFDAEVCYYDVRRLSPDEEASVGVMFRELDDLVASADIISLHLPYLPSTRHILSRERLGRMKRGAIVVNTARGELIDEQALADALRSGHLGGAGIDVFHDEPPGLDNPLFAPDLPNLVLTPHVAGSTFDNVENVASHIFGNVRRVLNGEPLPAADIVVPPGPMLAKPITAT
ncbi:MAG: 2-hydroxyacid dehydrogenase [Chloroflexota bacterium]